MDKQDDRDFNVLLKGYLDESLSPEDLETFLRLAAKPEYMLLLQQSFEKDLKNNTADLSSQGQATDSWSKLNAKLKTDHRFIRPRRFYMGWAVAAASVLCILAAAYFIKNQYRPAGLEKSKTVINLPSWLKPEHVGAVLYTTNGDSIKLDNQDKGAIATEDGVQVFQSAGSISYSGSGGEHLFNEIKTGTGKLFRCILPDQTIVWLNAESSIKYPLQFNEDHRSVEITGEVYFEVTHNAKHPFQVKAGKQIVEDIGTTFNIDATADLKVSTTLIEGSVSVLFNNKKEIMKPGEQAITSEDKNEFIVDQHANIEKAVAWKNGLFYFQNTPLRSVMEQLSNWYTAEVIYRGADSKELFSGQIDKSLTLTQVLQGLQEPGVSFRLNNNNQIIVIQK
jgi:transmembrane sensor